MQHVDTNSATDKQRKLESGALISVLRYCVAIVRESTVMSQSLRGWIEAWQVVVVVLNKHHLFLGFELEGSR